jgi:hypothetical protein
MRFIIVAVITFVSMLISAQSFADGYRFVRGEGNLLEAEVSLEKSNNVRLLLTCQSTNHVMKVSSGMR